MGFAKQFGATLIIFGLIGCVSTVIKTEASQDIVAKKAQFRWDALIKGDLATAYEYLSPGSRSVMSLELYKAKVRSGRWKKVSVDSVACEQDRCDVVMAVEYSYRDMESIVTRISETWLQEGNDWWYIYKK